MEKDYEDLLSKAYKSKKCTKNVNKETLTENEHKVLVEGYGCEEMLGVYDNLRDLELADLSDFFAMERRHGRT